MKIIKANKAVIAAFAVILAMVCKAGAFAQTVGDTGQFSGKNYRVAEVRADGSLVLQPAQGDYNIGDRGPGGGIIFYYSAEGFTVEMLNASDNYTAHYLEAAPADTGTRIKWGARGTLISGVTITSLITSPEANKIGNGRKDTALIVAAQQGKETGTAAQLCADLTTGGMRDWFLPSLGELKELHKQRTLPGINMIADLSFPYWSSTQASGVSAFFMSFTQSGSSATAVKDDTVQSVRAIRAF